VEIPRTTGRLCGSGSTVAPGIAETLDYQELLELWELWLQPEGPAFLGAPNSLGQEDPRGRKPMACRDWLEALEFAECGELLVSLVPLDDRELK